MDEKHKSVKVSIPVEFGYLLEECDSFHIDMGKLYGMKGEEPIVVIEDWHEVIRWALWEHRHNGGIP